MAKVVGGVATSFFFRGLDPNKIIENKRAGKYDNLDFPPPLTATLGAPIKVGHREDPQDGIYALRLPNNVQQIVATSNYKTCQNYMANGGTFPSGGRCEYCRNDFHHEATGIPIRMELKDGIFYFYNDGITCRDECSLSLIFEKQRLPVFSQDPLYMTSEQMLKLRYFLMNPDKSSLQKSKDYRLHQKNGGSLNDEQYYSETYTYDRNINLIIPETVPEIKNIPVRVQYTRHQ